LKEIEIRENLTRQQSKLHGLGLSLPHPVHFFQPFWIENPLVPATVFQAEMDLCVSSVKHQVSSFSLHSCVLFIKNPFLVKIQNG